MLYIYSLLIACCLNKFVRLNKLISFIYTNTNILVNINALMHYVRKCEVFKIAWHDVLKLDGRMASHDGLILLSNIIHSSNALKSEI
jgi:hypothetical protein